MSDFYKLKTRKNGKEYILNACTQDTEQNITGTKNFSKLTVNSKNVVTSINGLPASEDGNVEITTSGADLTGVVKSVNGIQPDESGSLTLEIPSTDGMVKSINSVKPDESGNISLNVFTTPGNIIKWETDYFDIKPSGLYSFDLSNTPFANIPREAINIQMVGKVKTAQNGYKVDDYVWPQYANYNGNTSGSEQGSTPYISGNVLSIRFGNEGWFVAAVPNGPVKGLNTTNVKVKLILTALIEEV